MKKLGLALCLLVGLAPAHAQPVTQPAPVGIAGAYNSSPPTCTTGQFCFAQVSVAGRMLVDAAISGGGDATAANQVLQIAQETAFNTALGAMADAACTTDNGTCSTIALLKRNNQRLTTLIAGPLPITLPTTPTIAAGNGVVPSTSSEAGAATTAASATAAASNLVIKNSAGNLYDLTVTIGATSGYVLLFDATALPGNGAVTPVWCAVVTSNGTNGGISAAWPSPKRFGTGITAGFSTTGCFTLTASATANFFGDYK